MFMCRSRWHARSYRSPAGIFSCAHKKQSPPAPFAIPWWLFKGKAYLKEQIAKRVSVDVSLLPYNNEFRNSLKGEHASGRELICATPTHTSIAEKIAEHLGIFSKCFATEKRKTTFRAHERGKKSSVN